MINSLISFTWILTIYYQKFVLKTSVATRRDNVAPEKEVESLRAEISQLRKELSFYKRPPSDRPRSPNPTIRKSQVDVVSEIPDSANRIHPEVFMITSIYTV